MGSLDFDVEEEEGNTEEQVESDEDGEEGRLQSDDEGILAAWEGQKKKAAGFNKKLPRSASSAFLKPKSTPKSTKGMQSSSSTQNPYDSDGEYVHPL